MAAHAPQPMDAANATHAWQQPETLALLRCPVTGAPLHALQDSDGRWWLVATDQPAGQPTHRYPVIDGVPRLVAEARVAD